MAEQPPLFDGATRLYIGYICPYAQRVWIARNFMGLQDKIELVPLDLQNKPAWYKDEVYPLGKVPSLEHDGKVMGESLDLIEYLDRNFEGPSLFPVDPAKRAFAQEFLPYCETLNLSVLSSFKGDPAEVVGPAFDYLENALSRFDDGPFFLGQFSVVDVAFVPFIERFQVFLLQVFEYDVTASRPKLASLMEEMNKIEAYTATKVDPKEVVEVFSKAFLVNNRDEMF